MAEPRPEPPRAAKRPRLGLPIVWLALGCLAGAVFLPGSAAAGDGWWGGLDEGEAVSLADVKRAPRSYRGRTLTFFCIFHGVEKNFDPFRTPFSPKHFDNFTVWPDGTPLWEEKAFVADLPFLYIRRNHQQRDALLRTAAYTRIEVTGAIREVLRGSPTIEVFSFRPTGHRLGVGVVKRMMRAHNYARLGTQEGYEMAARSYKEALTPDLPPLYVMHVRKLIADSLRKLGHGEEADAYERGETYGTSALPAPDPKALAPDVAPPQPGLEPPLGRGDVGPRPPIAPESDLPGRVGIPPPEPYPSVRTTDDDLPGRPSAPVTPEDDLPGSVGYAPPVEPPAASRTSPGTDPRPAAEPGGFPPPAMPGRRSAPPEPVDDWGSPPGAAPRSAPSRSAPYMAPAAPPLPAPEPGTRPVPQPQPHTARAWPEPEAAPAPQPAPTRRGPVSGIPPKRKPRISGVR